MAAEEKILTLHPEKGKEGKNILRSKYDIAKECLHGIFAENPQISHKELTLLSKERLNGKLEGNASWYKETVLPDLMAHGVIEKISDKPVKLRFKN